MWEAWANNLCSLGRSDQIFKNVFKHLASQKKNQTTNPNTCQYFIEKMRKFVKKINKKTKTNKRTNFCLYRFLTKFNKITRPTILFLQIKLFIIFFDINKIDRDPNDFNRTSKYNKQIRPCRISPNNPKCNSMQTRFVTFFFESQKFNWTKDNQTLPLLVPHVRYPHIDTCVNIYDRIGNNPHSIIYVQKMSSAL